MTDRRRPADAGSVPRGGGKEPVIRGWRACKVLGTEGFVVEAQRSTVAAAGAAGGRPPLLYRRGCATTLHPPLLRPATREYTPQITGPGGAP